MKRFALFGFPIEHSLSPAIYAIFAKACGVELEYIKIPSTEEEFETNFIKFMDIGCGGNVTAPLKEKALLLMDRLSSTAQMAHAVNVFVRDEAGIGIYGDNTDGLGLVRDLLFNCGVGLHGDILIVGAGGATRGILLPLLQAGPKSITIVNRTVDKAERIMAGLESVTSAKIVVKNFYTLNSELKKFDLIINATSMGLTGEVPPLAPSLFFNTTCYDLSYNKKHLAFLEVAQKHGAKQVFSGIGMLVEQAKLNFDLWFSIKPPVRTSEVIELLEQNMRDTMSLKARL